MAIETFGFLDKCVSVLRSVVITSYLDFSSAADRILDNIERNDKPLRLKRPITWHGTTSTKPLSSRGLLWSILRESKRDAHRGDSPDDDEIAGWSNICSGFSGCALLALMCFSFVPTVTLFLVSLPLLLIFSPVLIEAVAVLAAVMAGFLVAGGMWVAGISSLVWSGKQIGEAETIVGWMGVRVKELGQEWSHYLWKKADDDSPHVAHSS
ncbi:unnamed protein product [Thlaspi arvense]|uniref:Oleosin n=1 Tax=Thlaspi arvense TaxID=13288 RepID=A0AAU9T4S5_THLAR|nr:unnamed protein product [Thlaspi arvense]